MSTTPATPGPYSGTSLPAASPAARPPGLAEGFTDAQLQAAIDAAFPTGAIENCGFGLDMLPHQSCWGKEAPNRLAIARAFLAALPQAAEPEQAKPAAKPCGFNSALDTTPLPDDGPASQSFQDRMAKELAANAHKGEWSKWTPAMEILGEEIVHHLNKLKAAWTKGDCELVREFAADIANFASKAFDMATGLKPSQAKPGHGPQPATFEAHGKTWTRHTPGDPCPCDTVTLIDVLMDDEHVCKNQYIEFASTWNNIIGWRYADPAPAAPTEAAAKPRHGPQAAKAEPDPAPAAPTHEELLAEAMKHPGVADVERVYGGGQPPAKPADEEEWTEHLEELKSPIPAPWTPKPGDVVRLKSGGPEMTVTGVFNCPKAGWYAALAWFDNGRFGTLNATFPALQPAKEEARP